MLCTYEFMPRDKFVFVHEGRINIRTGKRTSDKYGRGVDVDVQWDNRVKGVVTSVSSGLVYLWAKPLCPARR